MTIVVYRDGVIAADSAGSRGDRLVGYFTKITKTDAGMLAGAEGEAGCIETFLKWVREGCTPDNVPDFKEDHVSGFTVNPRGVITGYNWMFQPYVVDWPFYGVGSGYAVAQGAMEAGATAERAVEIAIKYCDGCGGPVKTLRLDSVAPLDMAGEVYEYRQHFTVGPNLMRQG